MDDERNCLQCGQPLGNRRPGTLFHSQKCKRRYYRRPPASNYLDPPSPPSPGTAGKAAFADVRADERWRRALEGETTRAEPLDDIEQALLDQQRRNPGVLLPELHQRLLDQAKADRQAEKEARADFELKVETPLDPSSLGSVAARARHSRAANRPHDPHLAVLRPSAPGPRPRAYDDEPQCIDKASIGWR